jgi:DNA-binding XRE family transcriptional regulator
MAVRAPTPVFNGYVNGRPREGTALREWLQEHDVSGFTLARRIGCDPKTIQHLSNGRTLPTLILAFKIERETEGGVPIASWLGTELARIRWNAKTFDWKSFEEAKNESSKQAKARRRKA